MTKLLVHPQVKSTARDVFLYLLLISMLIVSIVSFLTVVFQYVNVQFPDTLDYYWREGALMAMRGGISALVIAWPVVLFMSKFIAKDLKSDKEKQFIWIRKWLLHLMLFVGAITIIIDLITLINTFLGGEVTTRFILKVLAVLVVAIPVFSYYLWELRRDPLEKTRIPLMTAIVSSLVILGSIVASFFVIGSPAQQRNVRMDLQRVNDLQTIQSSLINYWQNKDVLPENLSLLEDDLSGYRSPMDPETKQSYEYRMIGELSFELCATFETQFDSTSETHSIPVYYEFGYGDSSFDIWSHDAEHTCFERTIDPDRFKQEEPDVSMLNTRSF
ncbi:MAG: hypothetical protein UT30_C0001G0036 [Candidatus Uhrbacteria bacterium GW2011_GWF2_39_13]|uniref:DUF5671 domain-containing protein n=1 Tax=Candidatus Uhrbacteria bacterium GW2011_GWF2_39_13 TaxID=1618995 RepID=A0A0G0QTX0_9BACT|nr:MAG: hypothetical protein UT30_C0001G0036 [Candidatus Uhrbacteria bacterium GW2011_GWF2_39_13]HAU66362.1 hypothetical protein [Candidatus Uhrbacteria bacterium]